MDLSDLSPEDLRSFRLNEAALARAAEDWPGARALIARNLAAMRRHGRVAPSLLDRCEALLDRGPAAMAAAFLALAPEAQALRSVHPFAGLLTPRERTGIIRATSRRGSLEAV